MPGRLLNAARLSPELVLCEPEGEAIPSGAKDATSGSVDGQPPFEIHGSCRRQPATDQGPSEQFATTEALRVIPKGATITDTTCKSIDVGASSRYQCTITYSP